MKSWLKGLANYALNGIASGIILVLVKPDTFNFYSGLRPLLETSAALALLGVANYVKQSPLFPNGQKPSNSINQPKV